MHCQLKYEKNKNEKIKIKVYSNLGSLYYSKIGNYSMAREYFIMCLELAEKNKMQREKAIEHNNIGLLNYKLSKYKEAEEHFEKAMLLWTNQVFLSNVYNNLASVYEEENQYEQALNTYYKGLQLLK
eukprot:GHVR01129660.1.p1 GENE.GHVR01129660.1~~GHVR01129660.1.p1  ORF type:complete len:127 (+),score=3.74 GHVR01129660.1:114-494(+)